MVYPRAAHWSASASRRANRTFLSSNRTRSWKPGQKRSYASGGAHENPQRSGFPTGDIPWAIGSLAVTVPSVWYLAQPQIERYSGKRGSHGGHSEHGHGDSESNGHDEEHDEGSGRGEEGGSVSGEDSSQDAAPEGESTEGKEADSGYGSTEETERAQSGDEETAGKEETSSESPGGEGANKSGPDTPRDKGSDDVAHETDTGKDVKGVQFKGATSRGPEDSGQDDTRKHIPDAKGGNKKRIESHYGGKQGEANQPEQDPKNKDLAATAKPAGNFNTQSGKQEGLSNTDTKHSTDIANSPDKSTKGSGAPETAKEKGTVDPTAPAV